MSDISKILVRFILEGGGEAEGELLRFQSPKTIDAITKSLPLDGRVAKWKEEAYFEIPVKLGPEKAKSKVDPGTIAYWPMGAAVCIFYGPTQPYSAVNVLGKITKNLEIFGTVKSGTRIRMERA